MLISGFYIPGIKKEELDIIIKKFNIDSIVALKKVAMAKKIRKLKDFNSKTEMVILRGIRLLETKPDKLPLGVAWEFSNILIAELLTWSQINQVLIVGELRRGIDEVKSIELLLEAEKEVVYNKLVGLNGLRELKEEAKHNLVFDTALNIPVKFHFADNENWGTKLLEETGSEEHLQELKNINKNVLPICSTEEEIYSGLDLPFIPPEIRETGYEVQFAREGILPQLIELHQIRGDLHIHSRWSDGSNTVEEIVRKAIELGYEYLAITDHSQSLKVAGGLKAEDIERQIEEINKLQLKYPQLKILKGIEVDILENGNLDFTDNILKKLDLVIASIHSHFHMSEEKMTMRIIKALKHPLVNILAHPTGRVLGKRLGYKVNIAEIIKVAQEENKVLEVNASPDRLDLRDTHLQLAKTKGIKIAINSDAHNIKRMDDMVFGVQVAKRGWQTQDDIINSWSLNRLKDLLHFN